MDLPGADVPPPQAAPLGCGALPADQVPWVAETWALLRRFQGAVGIQSLPSLHELEAAVANPAASESALSLATDVHCALVSMLVDEAFSAALETEASINTDAKQRDMQGGYPVVTVRRRVCCCVCKAHSRHKHVRTCA